MKNRYKQPRAFTLVEVLTTVAIIGILLAVLIPALNQVGKYALVVKQKAQFHAIELALEAFRSDVGFYPPSEWNIALYGDYSASQRLAEAIIGRDGFGFHPASRFRADGKGDIDGDGILDPAANDQMIYNVNGVLGSGIGQSAADNKASRRGPYLELESANAVRLGDYFVDYGTLVNPDLPSFVLADVFKTTKLKSGRKVGMPILYYRANTAKTGHSLSTVGSNTYELGDSSRIISQPTPSTHPLNIVNPGIFYQRTQNPNFLNPARPYRAESFILHSAGPDGLYGTTDDVFNFDEGN